MNDESPPKGAPDTNTITNQHDTPTQRQIAGAAIGYAQRGWAVFPTHGVVAGRCTCRGDCSSPAKHPLTANGLRDATTDIEQIASWWRRRAWANVAVATGQRSGIFVLDVDDLAGLEHLDNLPKTLTARTGSGGLHYVFQHPGIEIRNRARVVPGIDVRADGGYVVAPPSRHISGRLYEWIDERDPARAPAWLIGLVRARPKPAPPPMPPATYTGADVGTRYGCAVLRDELKTLAGAPEGQRNDTLFRSAAAVFSVALGGELDIEAARRSLEHAALSTGLDGLEIRRTLDSARRAATPRRPERRPA